MKKVWWALGFAGALVAAGPVEAQVLPFGIEPRVFWASPMGDFAEDDLPGAGPNDPAGAGSGIGIGVDISLALGGGIGVYAGWDRTTFSGDNDRFGSEEFDYTAAGIRAGGQFGVPLGALPVAPWVRAGAIFHELELDTDAADEDDGYTDSFGFELGLGADINLGRVLTVTPEVGYRFFDAEPVDGFDPVINVRYLTVGTGVRIRI